mmetsp:Transcript_5588/g.19967  ORF Transcript_5588/g.19967 Transcript_5588/m.19967 type:complete len:875 (-) Transcript_5588:96-2720(-)
MGRKRKSRKLPKRGAGWRSVKARSNPLFECYYRRQLAPVLSTFPEVACDIDGSPMATEDLPAEEAEAEAAAVAAAAGGAGGDGGAATDGAGEPERKKGEPRVPSSVAEARAGPGLPERDERAFQAMLAAMRTPLACSWRIFRHSPVASKLLADLVDFREAPVKVVSAAPRKDGTLLFSPEDDEKLSALRPAPLPWYPDGLAFQIPCARDDMRKHPSLKPLHQFLVKYVGSGDIWRQETVSMVPALLLDVQSHHRVLDMCAAPGSKTSQLVELLHARDAELGMPQGVVVANDSNTQRCYMLVHMMKRIGTPCLLATTHEAQRFPSLTRSEDGEHTPGVGWFDRVLADVPCSGDGTIRKTPNMWTDWRPGHGIFLHPLQVSIALRGATQLKIGGRMVYSTCSLNPMENEAVVAQLLLRCGGSMRVVDCSAELPGLKRSPGLTTWSVMDTKGNWLDEDEMRAADELPKAMNLSMFPPKDDAILAQLSKAWRMVPSAQNTGGFFVCVLEKTAPIERDGTFLGAEKLIGAKKAKREADAAAAAGAAPAKRARLEGGTEAAEGGTAGGAGGDGGGAGAGSGAAGGAADDDDDEDNLAPDIAIAVDDATLLEAQGEGPASKKAHANDDIAEYDYEPLEEAKWQDIKKHYQLSDDFPSDGLFMRRSAVKCISWMCPAVTQLFRSKMAWRLRVVHSGMRAFMRDKAKKPEGETDAWCDFRLVQDSLHLVKPYFPPERIVTMPLDDFARLLDAVAVMRPFRHFTPATREALEARPKGSLATQLDAEGVAAVRARADGRGSEETAERDAALGLSPVLACSQMLMAAWRGNRAVSAYLTREDADVFRERLPPAALEAGKHRFREEGEADSSDDDAGEAEAAPAATD